MVYVRKPLWRWWAPLSVCFSLPPPSSPLLELIPDVCVAVLQELHLTLLAADIGAVLAQPLLQGAARLLGQVQIFAQLLQLFFFRDDVLERALLERNTNEKQKRKKTRIKLVRFWFVKYDTSSFLVRFWRTSGWSRMTPSLASCCSNQETVTSVFSSCFSRNMEAVALGNRDKEGRLATETFRKVCGLLYLWF